MILMDSVEDTSTVMTMQDQNGMTAMEETSMAINSPQNTTTQSTAILFTME